MATTRRRVELPAKRSPATPSRILCRPRCCPMSKTGSTQPAWAPSDARKPGDGGWPYRHALKREARAGPDRRSGGGRQKSAAPISRALPRLQFQTEMLPSQLDSPPIARSSFRLEGPAGVLQKFVVMVDLANHFNAHSTAAALACRGFCVLGRLIGLLL